MTKIKNHNQIYFLMSLAMISWAIAWTNAKIVGEYLSYYNLIFLRFFFDEKLVPVSMAPHQYSHC